ncbi:MAG: sigma-70 family RNA polymerase sigma factor [Maribacter sp.]
MQKEIQFTKVIQEHQGLLFKVSSVYTDSKLDQEDLLQEIVYQLWKSFDAFRNESKISTWMYRIGMNTAIAHLNQRKKRPNSISISETILKVSDTKDELYEERLRKLYLHLQKLNTLEKGLIFLLLEGKKYAEIAEITGLGASNVGTRISRIKKKLKTNMTKS